MGVESVAAVLSGGVGGFNLDTEKTASGFDDEVVAVAFTPGFGDAEAEAGSLVEKSGFGDFAAALAVEIECFHRAKQKAWTVVHACTFLYRCL